MAPALILVKHCVSLDVGVRVGMQFLFDLWHGVAF